METTCPLLKAIWLNNKYDDAIWFVERRKEFGDNTDFWREVYSELLKLNEY
jgi:hypothetical protein